MLVRHNPQRFRYELTEREAAEDERPLGFIDYRVRDGQYWLIHTELADGQSGTGSGSFLVRRTLDMLREKGVTIVPTCPFVAGWIRRHPEYADMVDTETLRSYKRSRSAGRRRVARPVPLGSRSMAGGEPTSGKSTSGEATSGMGLRARPGSCQHLPAPGAERPDPWPADGCAECLSAGRRDWVHLRVCVSCGHVGCCDSSPGRHAAGHHRQSGHPLIRSHEPGEHWWYCYIDKVTLQLDRLPTDSQSA